MESSSTSFPASAANPSAHDAATTLVRHFPVEVRDAYAQFVATRASAAADVVVLAVVLDHMPDKKRRPSAPLTDDLMLVENLGFDSIAITEMVFFLEDLFQVRIGNDEILRVRTVGDLRTFVREKIAAAAPAPGA